ncbi:gp53-like domain-containing protein [Xenorhabdus thuongxuanensis]|uniref:gp53-like domain-containing protein n=1 Tax=Xenorhabdus thuongxuanensis TaxID=1873484 RepID=UPI003BB5D4A9
MSFFTSGPNWFKMPDGRIIQYGTSWFSRESAGYFYADAVFPIPYSRELSCMFVTLKNVSHQYSSLFLLASDMNSTTRASIPMLRGELAVIPNQAVMWLAIGY